MAMAGEAVTIELAGTPQGKGRPRFVRATGHTFTPEKTRTYEGMIRTAAMEAMRGRERFDGPVRVELTAIFDVPGSYSKKKRADALANRLQPTKKPDSDNLDKCWHDAMNAVVYRDDAQIVHSVCIKKYGPAPIVIATVTPL